MSLATVATWAASFAAALVFMELWAGLLHRRVWHGPLWALHRSHHEPRAGRWEANDWLSSTHAPFALALILYGCLGKPSTLRELCYGAGLGMTAFGLLYVTFHDGVMHGRLPVGFLSRSAYVRLLCEAHEIHHRKTGGPYGFFYLSPRLRGALGRQRRSAPRATDEAQRPSSSGER